MAKYLIINNADDYFEYDTSDIITALDNYIKEQVNFENGFTLSETAWTTVKDNLSTSIITANRVIVINGLCKYDDLKIKKILSAYTTDYPD